MGLTTKAPPKKKRSKKAINRTGARMTLCDADGNIMVYRATVVPEEDEEKQEGEDAEE